MCLVASYTSYRNNNQCVYGINHLSFSSAMHTGHNPVYTDRTRIARRPKLDDRRNDGDGPVFEALLFLADCRPGRLPTVPTVHRCRRRSNKTSRLGQKMWSGIVGKWLFALFDLHSRVREGLNGYLMV